MKAFVVFAFEGADIPERMLVGVGDAMFACATASQATGSVTVTTLEDPAKPVPDGITVTISEESLRQHAGLLDLGL